MSMLNTNDILNNQISGFHQYRLDRTPHLTYASRNLCEMLQVQPSALLHDSEDRYTQFVHPADQERYGRFLKTLTADGQVSALEYRLIRKNGMVLWVKDTLSVEVDSGGVLWANSVLTDITDLKQENHDLQFLNETIPCGFLKYTCDKQPRITYINRTMQAMLRFPEAQSGEVDYLELYQNNIFLLIPMEERRRFSRYLERVSAANVPLAGEMTLLRCDGTRLHVFGWVTKLVDEDGTETYQSVCMDMTDRHKARQSKESERYIKALSDVYDKIFEFNLDANTLTCLYCEPQSSFQSLLQIAMEIDSASEKWIIGSVAPQDQERLRCFFRNFCQKKLYGPDAKPPQVTYQARSSDGTWHQYIGTFIKTDEGVGYYCCRRVPEEESHLALRTENDQLKENMKALVTQFMDGFAAFELSADGLAKPLYSSENVYEFFGYTEEEWISLMERFTPISNFEEEWISLMERFTPISNFIANSEAGEERFEELLRTGQAEFIYFDYKTEAQRRIKAVCSQKEADAKAPRYVMLYAMEPVANWDATSPADKTVFVRTFGYFDVFVGEQPVAFRSRKAKELLALLVDRRGGYVTSEEAISFLWEDEPANSVTLARYRKAALRLKNTLEEYGIADIIETVDGKRRMIPEKVSCDLYQYLTGKDEYAHLFKGSYLTNYSWGEATLGQFIDHEE